MTEPSSAPWRIGDGPLRRSLFVVTASMNTVGAAIILVGMILVSADVGMRDFFNRPIQGVIELLKMTIIAIVFLQVPHAVLSGRMIRSDVFLQALKTAAPRRAHIINTFHMICGAIFLILVAWGVWPQLMDAIKYDLFVGVWVGFRAPVWPIRTIIILGAVLGSVAYLFNAMQGEQLA